LNEVVGRGLDLIGAEKLSRHCVSEEGIYPIANRRSPERGKIAAALSKI
jgi:hypothetical protein